MAITGSAAARGLLPPDKTPVVPLRLLALYAASPRRLAGQLGLVEADAATAQRGHLRPSGPADHARPWGTCRSRARSAAYWRTAFGPFVGLPGQDTLSLRLS